MQRREQAPDAIGHRDEIGAGEFPEMRRIMAERCQQVDLRGLWPAQRPTRYVPLDDAQVGKAQKNAALSFGSRRISWLTRKMPASWVKHFAPGLVFLVRKQAG